MKNKEILISVVQESGRYDLADNVTDTTITPTNTLLRLANSAQRYLDIAVRFAIFSESTYVTLQKDSNYIVRPFDYIHSIKINNHELVWKQYFPLNPDPAIYTGLPLSFCFKEDLERRVYFDVYADRDYTLEISGCNHVAEITNSNLENETWWSKYHPELLIAQIKYEIAMSIDRNLNEAQEYKVHINDIITGIKQKYYYEGLNATSALDRKFT
ncbi:MAG: hypothetical protein ABIK73_06175 [candidate division WOR-3 bacterium]